MLDASQLIILAVVFPIFGAFLLVFVPEKSDSTRNPIAFFISLVTACSVLFILKIVLGGEIPVLNVLTIVPGLELAFKIDPLAIFFGTIASVLWVFAVLYSTGYMAHEHKRKRYFIFYLLSLGITTGIAFSANLFTLYLFYELLTICTYPLVIHEENDEAQQAGIKYIIYSFVGAGFILIAIVVTFFNAGTLDFTQGGIVNLTPDSAFIWKIVFVCFLVGFGVKAAIMPLHRWLPSAMAAPTPVSALLHAVAVVKSGVFGILRVMYSIYGQETLISLNIGFYLAVLVSITIITASIIAMQQDVLKKRLAFSTISQLGYITLGAALLNTAGLTGSLLHMFNHALLKITLFFCAGAIITVTGKKKISELKGIGYQMPITMIAFLIGSLGMIGIMPINGFISKWYLFTGSLDNQQIFIVLVLLVSAILNALYFLPIVVNAFFYKGDFKKGNKLEAPVSMLLPIVILSLLCILAGVRMDLTVPYIQQIVSYLQ